MQRFAWTSRMLVLLIISMAWGVAAIAEDNLPGAWLGVRLSGEAASDGGATVARVFDGSPADRAGLRARDRILTIGGVEVKDMKDLIKKIRGHDPGSWTGVTVLRKGRELDLDIRLSERPKKITSDDMRRGWIGLEAIDLPPSLRTHFGAPEDAGIMVSEVVEGSPAEAAGFELGDVIYDIDGVAIASPKALQMLTAGGGVGNDYEYSVARRGAELILEARIDRAPPKEMSPR